VGRRDSRTVASPGQEGGLSDRIPFIAQPMLATLVAKPFHEPGWIYEEKYDGFRILAYKEGNKVTLLSRNEKRSHYGFSADC
jgi:ATP-dependent DNA ligase